MDTDTVRVVIYTGLLELSTVLVVTIAVMCLIITVLGLGIV